MDFTDNERDAQQVKLLAQMKEDLDDSFLLESGPGGAVGTALPGLTVERMQPAATPLSTELGTTRADVQLKTDYIDMQDGPRTGYDSLLTQPRLTEPTQYDRRKDTRFVAAADAFNNADEDRDAVARAVATKSLHGYKRTHCTKVDGTVQKDVVLSRRPTDRPVPTRAAGLALPVSLRTPRESLHVFEKMCEVPVVKRDTSSMVPVAVARSGTEADLGIAADLNQRLTHQAVGAAGLLDTFATAGGRQRLGSGSDNEVYAEVRNRLNGNISTGSQPINMALMPEVW